MENFLEKAAEDNIEAIEYFYAHQKEALSAIVAKGEKDGTDLPSNYSSLMRFLDDPQLAAEIMSLYESPNYQLKIGAIKALSNFRSDEVISFILSKLDDSQVSYADKELFLKALLVIGEHSSAKAVKQFITKLISVDFEDLDSLISECLDESWMNPLEALIQAVVTLNALGDSSENELIPTLLKKPIDIDSYYEYLLVLELCARASKKLCYTQYIEQIAEFLKKDYFTGQADLLESLQLVGMSKAIEAIQIVTKKDNPSLHPYVASGLEKILGDSFDIDPYAEDFVERIKTQSFQNIKDDLVYYRGIPAQVEAYLDINNLDELMSTFEFIYGIKVPPIKALNIDSARQEIKNQINDQQLVFEQGKVYKYGFEQNL